MRSLRGLAILAFFVIAGASPAVKAQTSPGNDADSSAIKKVCADFSENFSRHDAHGVALTFSEDADFTNMNGRHSRGRADIESWFGGLFRGNLKESQRTDAVRSIRFLTPEIAEVDLDTVITGTKGPDGAELPARKGLMIVTVVKQHGNWLIGTFHEAEYPPPRGSGAPAAGAPAR